MAIVRIYKKNVKRHRVLTEIEENPPLSQRVRGGSYFLRLWYPHMRFSALIVFCETFEPLTLWLKCAEICKTSACEWTGPLSGAGKLFKTSGVVVGSRGIALS